MYMKILYCTTFRGDWLQNQQSY